jgi:acyl-CoA synthetase (AMP-forming)/AMP-acid ligase II
MQKTLDQVVAILGVVLANAILVPIHPVLRPGQIAHMANDCDMKLLITESSRVAELRGTTNVRLVLGRGPDEGEIVSLGRLRRECRAGESPFERKPDDPAAIIYTSGSTGKPKGIVISHRNLADGARIVAGYLKTSAADRIATVLSLTSDYGLNQLWQTLYAGSSLYLHDFIFPRDLFRLLATEKITALPLMPFIISRMFDSQLPGPEDDLDFSSLRYVCSTGGTVTSKMLEHLQKIFPTSEIVLMYGLTEAFRSSWLPADQLALRPGSIGKAIPEVELYVLDEHGNDCEAGTVGQLVHRGGCITKGYWNAPKATAESFRQIDRFPGETVVFSGDLVRRDEEGYLYFVGRMGSMIKTHGFRVSPTEIEEYACRFNGINEAVAFGIDNPKIGQEIALAYTAASGTALSSGALTEHFRAGMPYHMVPRWFVHMEAFPAIAGGGKVDRVLVRQLCLEKLASNRYNS